MGPRIPAAPLAHVTKCLQVENRGYFYADLSGADCAPVVFLPTPGNRGWPWGGLRALDRRRRRAESRGIGRLTSDIGLRPNARCPARERGCDGGGCGCWPLASTPAKPRDREKERTATATPVAACTLPKLHGRRGSWCRGVFPFFENGFWKT